MFSKLLLFIVLVNVTLGLTCYEYYDRTADLPRRVQPRTSQCPYRCIAYSSRDFLDATCGDEFRCSLKREPHIRYNFKLEVKAKGEDVKIECCDTHLCNDGARPPSVKNGNETEKVLKCHFDWPESKTGDTSCEGPYETCMTVTNGNVKIKTCAENCSDQMKNRFKEELKRDAQKKNETFKEDDTKFKCCSTDMCNDGKEENSGMPLSSLLPLTLSFLSYVVHSMQ